MRWLHAQVFLNAATSKKQAMQTRLRGVEWWMKRKKLPQSFRHRVRQHERQRWAATRGVDECRIVRDLPEGLRRDIKYHLCLDLVRQVPLFHHMDDLVLENICDRVKSLIFPKGEIVSTLLTHLGLLEAKSLLAGTEKCVTTCCMYVI